MAFRSKRRRTSSKPACPSLQPRTGSFDRAINACWTRCVRVCAEIEGAHIWDVKGRGINSDIIADLNQEWGSSACTRCGKCVQVCPTGALYDKSKIGSDHPKYPESLPYLNLMREAQ